MLLICIFGTFIRHNSSLRCPHTLAYSSSFLLLGLANSLEMLFFSRILDGLLGGDIALAQAYIAGALSVRSFSSLFFFFLFLVANNRQTSLGTQIEQKVSVLSAPLSDSLLSSARPSAVRCQFMGTYAVPSSIKCNRQTKMTWEAGSGNSCAGIVCQRS